MDPSGTFFTHYAGDRSLVRTRAQWACLALLLLVLATLPWWASERWVSIGYTTFITAVAVVGLQICTGYAGQINLGQSAFMGVGAYGAALAMAAGWDALAALLIGGMGAALFGVMFGLTAARIKGFYLALTTIAAQALFHFLVLNLPQGWLGGAGGLHVEAVTVLGISLGAAMGACLIALSIGSVLWMVDSALPRSLASGLPALLLVLGSLQFEARARQSVFRPGLHLGDMSYSLYLTHVIALPMVTAVFSRLGARSGFDLSWAYPVVAALFALLVAAMVYRVVEKPLTRQFRSLTGELRAREAGA
jgi:ABC-type branched-subunit amino acid transport system permease subunit